MLLARSIEASLTSAAGALLGFGAGLVVAGPLGAVAGALVAGLNRFAGGARAV